MHTVRKTYGTALVALALGFLSRGSDLGAVRVPIAEARTSASVQDSLYRLVLVEDTPLPARIRDYLFDAEGKEKTCWRLWHSGVVRISGRRWSARDSTTAQCEGEEGRLRIREMNGTMRLRHGEWHFYVPPTPREDALEVRIALVSGDTLFLNVTSDARGGDVYLRDRRR